MSEFPIVLSTNRLIGIGIFLGGLFLLALLVRDIVKMGNPWLSVLVVLLVVVIFAAEAVILPHIGFGVRFYEHHIAKQTFRGRQEMLYTDSCIFAGCLPASTEGYAQLERQVHADWKKKRK